MENLVLRWRSSLLALCVLLSCVSVNAQFTLDREPPGPSSRKSGFAITEIMYNPKAIPGLKTTWVGWNMIVQNLGAFFGMIVFTRAAQKFGRKTAFAVAFLCAFVATVGFFRFFNSRDHIWWMTFILGFCQLALFAGFAIYLPELFPLRLRSTGTSFYYNVGRFIAASGPFTLGKLQAWLARGATTPEAKLEAFRHACMYLSVVFLLGLIALIFLPETKGKPMPED